MGLTVTHLKVKAEGSIHWWFVIACNPDNLLTAKTSPHPEFVTCGNCKRTKVFKEAKENEQR